MKNTVVDQIFWGMLACVLAAIIFLTVTKIEKLEPRPQLNHPTPTGTVMP